MEKNVYGQISKFLLEILLDSCNILRLKKEENKKKKKKINKFKVECPNI